LLRFIFHGSLVHILVYTRDELTEDDKQRIIKEHHENALGGQQQISRTLTKISQLYQRQWMRAQIREYIKKCPVCQVNKTPNQTIWEPMVITTTQTSPFVKIFMDIVGPGKYLRNYASKKPQNWDVYVPYAMYCHDYIYQNPRGSSRMKWYMVTRWWYPHCFREKQNLSKTIRTTSTR